MSAGHLGLDRHMHKGRRADCWLCEEIAARRPPRVVALSLPSDTPYLRRITKAFRATWCADHTQAVSWATAEEGIGWIEERLPGWLAEMEREQMPVRLIAVDVIERARDAAWPPDLPGFWCEGVSQAVIVRCRSCRWTLPLAKDTPTRAAELLGVLFHGAEHQATARFPETDEREACASCRGQGRHRDDAHGDGGWRKCLDCNGTGYKLEGPEPEPPPTFDEWRAALDEFGPPHVCAEGRDCDHADADSCGSCGCDEPNPCPCHARAAEERRADRIARSEAAPCPA
jgi:hypothetical protein